LKKGVGVAILSGVMSACFAYGLAAGDAIKVLTLKHGTPVLWQGLPVLVVVLIGGFVTNFVWCLVQMGRYKFSSWTLHMASIIIFSSLWGIGFKEWKGSVHVRRNY
jgi:L-rhamnose-H+ transport protein